MTLQIELPDELASRIQQEAERRGVPVGDLIHKAVRDVYAQPSLVPGVPQGRIQSIEEAAKASLEKNEELYRRLAQ